MQENTSQLSSGRFGSHDDLIKDLQVLVNGMAFIEGEDPVARRGVSAISQAKFRQRRMCLQHLSSTEEAIPEFNSVKAVQLLSLWPDAGYVVIDWSDPNTKQSAEIHRKWMLMSEPELKMVPAILNAAQTEELHGAISQLFEASPDLAQSVLPFVSGILFFDVGIPSWYIAQAPETIGLSTMLLDGNNRNALMESLIHESLHEKYSVINSVLRLFVPKYTNKDSPLIYLPWSANTEEYSRKRWFHLERSLSTLHVYAHASVLQYQLMKKTNIPEQRDQALQRLRKNYLRADYLYRQLSDPEFALWLTPDGQDMRDWLNDAMQASIPQHDVDTLRLTVYSTEEIRTSKLVEA